MNRHLLSYMSLYVTGDKKRIEIVKELLTDPTTNPADHDNLTLRWAVENGYIEIIEILLKDKRVDPVVYANFPIRVAAGYGYTKIVKLLLDDERVDPTAENNMALRDAAVNGYPETVKVLLNDPRVNLSNNINEAIRWIAKNGHIEMMKIILNDPHIDWRKIQDIPVVQEILSQENIDVEKRLSHSYLSLKQIKKQKIEKEIKKNITELGVYKGFYEEYCSNIPTNMKIPPIKLVLIADKLNINYDRDNINWSELCTKVRIRLDHFLN